MIDKTNLYDLFYLSNLLLYDWLLAEVKRVVQQLFNYDHGFSQFLSDAVKHNNVEALTFAADHLHLVKSFEDEPISPFNLQNLSVFEKVCTSKPTMTWFLNTVKCSLKQDVLSTTEFESLLNGVSIKALYVHQWYSQLINPLSELPELSSILERFSKGKIFQRMLEESETLELHRIFRFSNKGNYKNLTVSPSGRAVSVTSSYMSTGSGILVEYPLKPGKVYNWTLFLENNLRDSSDSRHRSYIGVANFSEDKYGFSQQKKTRKGAKYCW
ncbi:hypothetical protein GEMRC1_002532 [Eukaryota sp. GEM-RC1]